MAYSDDGFAQDYELGRQQELWLYCRLCRRTFPVEFRPKSRDVRLRCLCGHDAPLSELDVFSHEQDAREHAAFYARVHRAAKDALRAAGLRLPPSGSYRQIEDVMADSTIESAHDPDEDASDVAAAYVERDESDVTPVTVRAGLREFERRLEGAADPLDRHEILSELVEWTYVRRYMNDDALQRFLSACREDLELAGDVVAAAKAAARRGAPVRVSFSSFKHLVLHHRDEGELAEAAEVAERAAALGLKGYAQQAVDLRRELG